MYNYKWKYLRNYVLISINTTGLSPSESLITEICLIKVKNNEIIDKLLINIEDDSKYYSKISKNGKYLSGSTKVMEYIDKIEYFRENLDFVGWCIDFTISFLSTKAEYDFKCDYIDAFDDYYKKLKDIFIPCTLKKCYEWNFMRSSQYKVYDFNNVEQKCLAIKQMYDSTKRIHDIKVQNIKKIQ